MTPKTKARERKTGRILTGPAGWSYADWNGMVYPAHRPRNFHEAASLASTLLRKRNGIAFLAER
ncbi:MAG: hypothetical protein ACRD41_10130 [Candidatus Acidiferrales bacterium]